MALSKSTTGTITADEIMLIGIKRRDESELQPDGKTWIAKPVIVGYARYEVDGLEREVEFGITAANVSAVKTAIGARALAAIKAKEGVA